MGNRLTRTLIVLLCLVGTGVAAISPQDEFLQLYFSLQEADRLEHDGQYATARARYKDAADKLDDLKKNHPEWEPSIVNFRIKFVRDKITDLADKTDSHPDAPAPTPAPAATTTTSTSTTPATLTTGSVYNTESAPSTSDTAPLKQRIADLEKELADTKQQLTTALGQAAQFRQRLEAAERELATAKSSNLEDRVASIMAENNSLKAQLADAEQKMKALQDGNSADSVPMLKDQLQKVQSQLAMLENENQAFKTITNDLKQQLELSKSKLADADRQAAALNNGGDSATHRENEVLMGIVTRQLQEQARRDAAKRLAGEEIENLHISSKVLQQQIEILGSPIITLSPEEKALLRVDTASVVPSTLQSLEAHLDASTNAPSATSAPISDATAPAPTPASAAAAGDASTPANAQADLSGRPKVPDEMKPLAQQAGALFAQGKYDDAADIYNKIIKSYPDSLYAWSNLGVVRFQEQRYPEAEKALLQSIKLNPNDAFSYSILGIVYYQENRFDDAIDKLTRASTLDPNDARTRNYLGIACSQKGWQEAAEKQLRKAIEIDPTLGDAHFNLAVIYATQKPPSRELARKHYKAALDLGIPKDPQLEKFFADDSGATSATSATSPAPATTPAPASGSSTNAPSAAAPATATAAQP